MEKATLAKFTSLHDDTCKDFNMVEEDVLIGRKKTCTHRIMNNKISGEHCRVKLDKESGVFTIIDKSTNGTFVNGNKINKDEPAALHSGDKIYLLNDEAEDLKIGFIFVTVFEKKSLKLGGKRSSQEIEKDESNEEQSEIKKRLKRADTPAEVQQLKCSFCLEVMYKPVSLLPCLHNFCGGCYADWMVKRNECPECRDKVKQIKRNHMINSMIEQYLKKNPDQEKSKEIKDDQDEKDCFNNNVVTYQNAKKLKKEHDEKVAEDKKNNKNKKPEPKDKDKEVNVKEEEKEEDKEEDKKVNKEEEKKKEEEKQPVRKPPNKRECRNCDKAINRFQCSNDTRHVVCSACKQVFPISGKPGINIQCICCRQYFCHQHWNCKNHARNKVSILHMLPFAGITANSLFKNQYEQRVLKDYIKFKGFSVIQFRDNMLSKCDAAADWEINDALGGTQILAKNSSVCMNCANDVWERVIYCYREAIHNELPQNVKSRSDCWYGFECRTQIHNFSHASRLNHICSFIYLD